jgi:hypothetical protein
MEALWMILDDRLPPDTGASVCAFLDELVTQGRLGDAAMYARWYDRLQERFGASKRPQEDKADQPEGGGGGGGC